MKLQYRLLFFCLLISTILTLGYCQQAYGLIQFEQKVDYKVGNTPTSVAVADLNNDQKVDLAVTNLEDNSVSILLGNGDGTFQAAVNYNTGEAPEEVVASDFNADGNIDLAIANSFDDTLSILMGKGDASFEDAVSCNVGEFPLSIAVADFNGDNKDDLAVANFSSSPGNVSILLGNGDGTFQDAVSLTAGNEPTDIYSSDFNGDTHMDLAVANSTDHTVSILLGNGDGTFQAAVNYQVGQSPFGITGGDFNHDKKEDLAIANGAYISNIISILMGKGDGTFQTAVNYVTGKWPIAVAATDFDQDGSLDLAVANSGDDNVSILQGSGNGAFQLALNLPAGDYPYDLIASDLNEDGWDDLVVVNNNPVDSSEAQEQYVVSVLLNNSSTCPLNLILSDNNDALALLRNFRDTRLALNTQGKRYIDLYYRHALEVTTMLTRNNDLMQQVKSLLNQLLPVINSLQQGKKKDLSQKMIAKIESLLEKIESQSSPGLCSSVYELRNEIKGDGLFQILGINRSY